MESAGWTENGSKEITINGKKYRPRGNAHWKTTYDGINRLIQQERILFFRNSIRYKMKISDFPVTPITNIWSDLMGATNLRYVVQTNEKVIQRCILMTTDPGDLVFDPTCGSGTTAAVAERWGRRWITCDTSRVALTLAKQRLMTANFDYYQLAHPGEGIGSGFNYKTVPHITLKSIANNEPPATETLYDQPLKDSKKSRVSGPFTVEAVPAPYAKSLDELGRGTTSSTADNSIARSGETLRQSDWRDELLRTGVRGKKGQKIMFSRVEPLSGTRYIQAEAETAWSNAGADCIAEEPSDWKPQKVWVVFGPEHAPLEQRQVEMALQEADKLRPKAQLILFAAFQFDPEAAKDIEETNWPGITLLRVQMNADLLTNDLKKKHASNESFWLIGQPDVALQVLQQGENTGKWQATVSGFDYFNTKTGTVESGNKTNIALWMLDTNYDGRSLFPSQVFFPMAGNKDGWSRLAKNLKAEIDEDLIEAYKGNTSLPFELGDKKRIAVKIVDDRGIESLRVLEAEQ